MIENLCPKHKTQAQQPNASAVVAASPDQSYKSLMSTLLDELHSPSMDVDNLELPVSPSKTSHPPDASDSTKTLSHIPAAKTRSLENSQPSAAHTSTSLFIPDVEYNHYLIKVLGLSLVILICITWICLRCRDPRRRAECLARREERRNKKLYRRAARQHKVKMWFWKFRVRYGLAPREDLSWDEKRTRVLQQERVLEDAMTDDIRAFRNAHRIVSLISAAEEGRDTVVHESEGSGRRRSFSILPGYESEGSQPPTYESVEGGLDEIRVANGFRYMPAETEFRSDSSVISTSPRISRDGTNSDFDEKFEPISLEGTVPAGSGLDNRGL